LADKLLAQAQGSRPAEAAVIVLVEALQGRLLDAVTLLGENDTMAEIDWPSTREATGYLSGGERRLLALADSLASGHPVDLSDTLTGLDSWNAQVVVDAMAHAAGVHHWGYDR
jgi:ABC-type transport system involved in cytochrome bd biosynthesis fused ATPase/permease subunit